MQIETGVEIPKSRFTGMTDVLRNMQIGECLTFDTNYDSNIYLLAKRINVKITARKSEGKIRVWRVA